MKSPKKTMMILLWAMAFFMIVSSASAKTWKIAVGSGHPPIFLFISTIHDTFIPYVNEHLAPLGHKIEWKEAYGGTLCKVGGCLEALQKGVVEVAAVSSLFEASNMPLHNVSYYAPFGTNDIAVVMDTIIELENTIPEMADEWTRYNMVPLGGSALDTYNLYTTFPVKSVVDIAGRKIGSPGSIAAWLKGTDGVAVASNLNEAYNALELGVYDGYVGFDSAAMGLKLFEVAPNVSLVNFGAQFAGGLAINKKFFDRLPTDVQKVFKDAGSAYSKKFAELQTARANGALAAMKKAGTNVIPFSEEMRTAWANKLPNVAMEWAEAMEAKGLPGKTVVKGYLDGLRKRGVKLARDWDKE